MNRIKNILSLGLSILSVISCEKMVNFTTTIDAPSNLIYMTPPSTSVSLVHTPIGTNGEYIAKFPIHCNSGLHEGTSVLFTYDPEGADLYNRQNNTNYAKLPESFITIENPNLTLPKNARMTSDSVIVKLSGDLEQLSEKKYICAFKIESNSIDVSIARGHYFFEVNTEVSCLRPISSESDIIGSLVPASERATWTADADGSECLFNNRTGGARLNFSVGQLLTIDMQKEYNLTGLYLYGYIRVKCIEYSIDGQNWLSAGTPVEGEYQGSSRYFRVGFYDYIKARYIRFECYGYYSNYPNYNYFTEFYAYAIDNLEPVLSIDGDSKGTINILKTPKDIKAGAPLMFKVKSNLSSKDGFTASAIVDNSLIAEYNLRNKSSYVIMPTENYEIKGGNISIPARAYESSTVEISLKGDLSNLSDENGYLIPIKVSSQKAKVEENSVYYVVVEKKEVFLQSNFTINDVIGAEAESRNWELSTSAGYFNNLQALIDGDMGSTAMLFDYSYSSTDLTIKLDKTANITGLVLGYSQAGAFNNVEIFLSNNGTEYKSYGVASTSDGTFITNDKKSIAAFYEGISAEYIKLKIYNYYITQLSEVNLYIK